MPFTHVEYPEAADFVAALNRHEQDGFTVVYVFDHHHHGYKTTYFAALLWKPDDGSLTGSHPTIAQSGHVWGLDSSNHCGSIPSSVL